MWLEITDKVIDLPGIFILKDNPITVGAWSVLPSTRMFALWIHRKRHTATFIRNSTPHGEKCTFSITDDLDLIRYCGQVSGRNTNKLEKVPTTVVDGYRYVSNSEYTIFLSIYYVQPIYKDFYLVMCQRDKILNFKGGEPWIRINY